MIFEWTEKKRTEKKMLPWAAKMCPGFHKSFEQFLGCQWTVSSENHNQHQTLSLNWTRICCLVCSALHFSEFLTTLVHLKLMMTERREMRRQCCTVFGKSMESSLTKFVKIKNSLFDPMTQLLEIFLTDVFIHVEMKYGQWCILYNKKLMK